MTNCVDLTASRRLPQLRPYLDLHPNESRMLARLQVQLRQEVRRATNYLKERDRQLDAEALVTYRLPLLLNWFGGLLYVDRHGLDLDLLDADRTVLLTNGRFLLLRFSATGQLEPPRCRYRLYRPSDLTDAAELRRLIAAVKNLGQPAPTDDQAPRPATPVVAA